MTLPKVIYTLSEIKNWRKAVTEPISWVPTMGALHSGHAALLRKQRKNSKISVLSIFVNPTQFGPLEDFSKYPRTFEADLEIAANEGVDLVFAPSPQEMYPLGYSTFVEEMASSIPLCGAARPGHFRGVTTVVLKLFNLIRPEMAYFGLKDAQQFFVLNKMVWDLNLDLTLYGIPTVRDPDSLALSSRNRYLSSPERKLAPHLSKTLEKIREELQICSTLNSLQATLIVHRQELEKIGFRVHYLDCVELPFLQPVAQGLQPHLPYLVAVAASLGNTRLIDNRIIREEMLAQFGIQVELE